MQIEYILPDGSIRSLAAPVTLNDIAHNISPGLAKIAIAGKINGQLSDLSANVPQKAKVEILTNKSDEGVDVIRHSTAHLMAMAIQDLFPGTQITIGPVVENQFYYDIFPKEGVKIGAHDFPAIEARMREIVAQDVPVTRHVMFRQNAIEHFESLGETFKVELIKDIPEDQEISVYKIGDWGDLCRGPHVPSTGKLTAFKLMSIAGAYWRGNKDNPQLVRIYGTAWGNQKELDTYLHLLEEAKRRDHIMLGKELHLFTILGDVAPGAAFFFPNGTKLFTLLQNYIRKKWRQFGFQEINTPQVMTVNLWKTSGHYEKFKEDMYLFKDHHGDELGIKPMSCPAHVRMFMVGQKSYRDLPLRFGEFGVVHRNELSGALHGLTRVRRITQDDGHIFCTLDQIESEIEKAIQFVQETYSDFGFKEVFYYFSTRPKNKLGTDEMWDKAEESLANSLNKLAVKYQLNPGDGAFYGPKIDFKVKDAIGRMHQCATIQLDFQMPLRFGAWYQTNENSQETPVLIHRAVFGSVERFLGVFIEHTAGHFPLGLAPIQCRIVTVTTDVSSRDLTTGSRDVSSRGLTAGSRDVSSRGLTAGSRDVSSRGLTAGSSVLFANEVYQFLRKNGVRVESDTSTEKLSAKIRNAQLLKIPYMIVIGDKEAESKLVTVRYRDGKNLAPLSLENLLALIKNESGVFWGLDIDQV